MSDEGSTGEVLARIAQTTAALAKLKPIWKDKNISLTSKEEENTEHGNTEDKWVSPNHVTNKEVREKVSQAIGPHDDLLTTVMKKKLRWYSHITRSSGLAKTILQGTAQGGRRQGRQNKRL